MKDRTQHSVKVNLIIKAHSRARALEEIAQRLNAWFQEDTDRGAPYEDGSLLYWGSTEESVNVSVSLLEESHGRSAK